MNSKIYYGRKNQQKGIATILVVVLVGVALTASSLGLVHSMRNAQETQLAVHASTHAETGAWVGIEAFNQYLATQTEDTIEGIPSEVSINFGADGTAPYGNTSAKNIVVTANGANSYRVSTDIVNIHSVARSSTTLNVVYDVTFPTSGGSSTVELTSAVNFLDDLEVRGAISFASPESGPTTVNVDGSFTALTVGLENVSVINATGAVHLSSQVEVEQIHSNSDVTLVGGAHADFVSTTEDIYLHAVADAVKANGNIFIYTSGNVMTAEARGNIEVTAGDHGYLNAGGIIDLNAWASDIAAKGDITLGASATELNSITGEGNLTCASQDWMNFGDISINGTLSASCILNSYNTTSYAVNQNNTVNIIDEISPIEIPRIEVDVWKLKDEAHFVFEYDADIEQPIVTVKNINNIPDGEYLIGKYADNYQAFLCSAVDSNGFCTSPALANRYFPICLASSEWTGGSCLTYNPNTSTWIFENSGGGSMSNAAPGVMWFDGNLSINSGLTFTTFLATGDVVDNGIFAGASVNFAGYDVMCLGQPTDIEASSGRRRDAAYVGRTDYNSLYSGFYPTDLCDLEIEDYIPSPIGNISIAAGGYDPDDGGSVYSGGDISLGNTSRAWGTILAGAHLNTDGSTSIMGYVNASNLNQNSLVDNTLGGGTGIDLSVTTEDYNPAVIPNMGSSVSTTPGTNTVTTTESKVLWARYL